MSANNPQGNPVSRTIERAAQALGGIGVLAEKLGCSVAEIERWIAGTPPPPETAIYLEALSIVSVGRLSR